ncbi:hypothetical protein V6Z11_D07G238600 [Gossypium hirsutum]
MVVRYSRNLIISNLGISVIVCNNKVKCSRQSIFRRVITYWWAAIFAGVILKHRTDRCEKSSAKHFNYVFL